MSETSSNNLLVVGSVAIDWIITPHAERAQSVGGSATYFSMAGGGLAPIQLVGVVGEDFPRAAVDDLVARGVDVDGLGLPLHKKKPKTEIRTAHWEFIRKI